jgi:hypothetical protein
MLLFSARPMVDLIYMLSIVAAAVALYFKFSYRRGVRRLVAQIEQQLAAEKEKAASGDTESKVTSEDAD